MNCALWFNYPTMVGNLPKGLAKQSQRDCRTCPVAESFQVPTQIALERAKEMQLIKNSKSSSSFVGQIM